MTVLQLGNITNYECSPALVHMKLLTCAPERQQQESPQKGNNGFEGGGRRQILSNPCPS